MVHLDTDWQEWTFPKLVKALRKRTIIINPLTNQEPRRGQLSRKERMLQTNRHRQRCVYCNGDSHISSSCNKVTTVDKKKKILREKKQCYSCTRKYHSAAEYRSKYHAITVINVNTHQFCNKKTESVPILVSSEEKSVTYPVVVALINGIKCRALLNSGAGSFYISSTISNLLRKPPVRKKPNR